MTRRVAVAASGGRDSTALLHATCHAARDLGLEVVALHVHHGLMPQADAWAAQVRRQCARWASAGLPLRCVVHRLTTGPTKGQSVEAWARRERYRALAAMAREEGADLVLLAHHRQDQAETVLLQALRGAGPAGLAAMPRCAQREGLHWCRPWLDRPRAAIEAYVRRHRLSHVDDGSNHDPRYARSRLRQVLWPRLAADFPGAEASLAHAARRAQEAAAALEELARIDHADCVDDHERLQRQTWCRLTPARRANLLRHWLGARAPAGAPDSLVDRLLEELPVARSGSSWPLPGARLWFHRGGLHCVGAAEPTSGDSGRLDLSRPGTYPLPAWRGALVVRAARAGEAGVAAALLRDAEWGARREGLQFQRAPKTPARSLKKAFQEAGLAAAARAVPLIFARGQLVFVPGLGLDARALAGAGAVEERLQLDWQPER